MSNTSVSDHAVDLPVDRPTSSGKAITPAAAIAVQPVDVDSPALSTWLRVGGRASMDTSGPPTEQRVEYLRPVYRKQRLTAATAANQTVGTFRSWDLDLTVPGGGTVTADAISSVSVAPTHRRRGILSAMMRADLADAVDRGVPVAVLIASQGGIYGRFGFGPSTESIAWSLDRRAAGIRPEAMEDLLTCRSVEVADLRRLAPEIYRRARQPGAVDRDDAWWDLNLGLVPGVGGLTMLHEAVLHIGPDGTPDGYVRYQMDGMWVAGNGQHTTNVLDLVTVTPAAYRALWRYLAELDLVTTVRALDRAVDDALPWLLTDPRAAQQVARCDFQWSRLLNPAAALSARSYHVPGSSRFEVLDPDGWAAGRFTLEAAADGTGECREWPGPVEVTLTVQALSALWLGGGSLPAAALSGQVIEHSAGAVGRLATLLSTTRAPWTSTRF